MRFRRNIRQFHRWVGLLIGVQVLLWISGGVVMSFLKLDEVRGAHLAAESVPPALSAETGVMPISAVLDSQANWPVHEALLTFLLEQPVYQLRGPQGMRLVDAISGTLLSPVTSAVAAEVARRDYAAAVEMEAPEWVETQDTEYRGRDLPLWRVRVHDQHNTALYIAPDSGRVVARRNDLWRLFDFVWMLHIMDYEEREDFNHPLLLAFAISALLFSLSGGVMLFYSFRSTLQRRKA